jgi:hypothetical protein
MMVEGGVFLRENIPDRVGLSAGDVQNLASLPEGYFAAGCGQVIDLSEIRLRRGMR